MLLNRINPDGTDAAARREVGFTADGDGSKKRLETTMVNKAQDLIKVSERMPPQLPNAQCRWEYVMRGDKVQLLPVELPPALFRGQNTRYSPSYPAIARGLHIPVDASPPFSLAQLSSVDQATFIIDLVKSWWFCQELDRHPAMIWADDEGIYVNKMALAQHYELSTGYMDVTQSFKVACFFATCEQVNGLWQPKGDGEGIVYRVAYHELPHPLDSTVPIGLQPFPRPAEQWGWVIDTRLGEDFETNPVVTYVRFRHDLSVSEYFFGQFDEGRSLFPTDAMSTVASRIKAATAVPRTLIDAALNQIVEDPLGIEQSDVSGVEAAIEERVELVGKDNQPRMLGTEQLRQLEQDWERRKTRFFEQVSVRLVRNT